MKVKTSNQLSRGVDIEWLSCFPGEEEVVFPSLTFMKHTGVETTREKDGFKLTIFEVSTTIA